LGHQVLFNDPKGLYNAVLEGGVVLRGKKEKNRGKYKTSNCVSTGGEKSKDRAKMVPLKEAGGTCPSCKWSLSTTSGSY